MLVVNVGDDSIDVVRGVDGAGGVGVGVDCVDGVGGGCYCYRRWCWRCW